MNEKELIIANRLFEKIGDDVEDMNYYEEIMNVGVSIDKGFTEEDVNGEQLEIGIKVEMEHTTNEDIAKKIALDHLAEIPDYYTRLEKMEADAKGEEENDE